MKITIILSLYIFIVVFFDFSLISKTTDIILLPSNIFIHGDVHMGGLGKQAKILTERQVKAVLAALGDRRYPARDRVMVLLSVRAGLRAKEIALATWGMVTDAEGNVGEVLHLQNGASKGKRGGRAVPLNKELRASPSRPPGTLLSRLIASSIASATSVCRPARCRCGFTGCTNRSVSQALHLTAAGARS
jgi:hypothetical protein